MRLIYFIIIISLSLHSQNEIKSIDFDEYSSLSKSKDFLIVDVRTPEEHKISRINNSININFYDEKFINIFVKLNITVIWTSLIFLNRIRLTHFFNITAITASSRTNNFHIKDDGIPGFDECSGTCGLLPRASGPPPNALEPPRVIPPASSFSRI